MREEGKKTRQREELNYNIIATQVSLILLGGWSLGELFNSVSRCCENNA